MNTTLYIDIHNMTTDIINLLETLLVKIKNTYDPMYASTHDKIDSVPSASVPMVINNYNMGTYYSNPFPFLPGMSQTNIILNESTHKDKESDRKKKRMRHRKLVRLDN